MQGFSPDTRTFKHAWPEIFNKYVGAFNQSAQDVPSFARLPVEAQNFFVAAQSFPPNANSVPGLWSEIAHHIRPVGCLNLDDVCPKIRKQRGREWSSNNMTEFDDFQLMKWGGHMISSLII